MVINGTDYSLYIVIGLTVAVLAGLEYFICLKSTKSSYRKILLFVPFLVLTGALMVYGSESGGGLFDLRGLVVVLLVIYALICAAAIGAGRFIYKLKHENKPDVPEDCPMADKTDN